MFYYCNDLFQKRKEVIKFQFAEVILMSYGWATIFTLAAWFAGLMIDGFGDLGLRIVLPVIVMGCCIMKYIKDSNNR